MPWSENRMKSPQELVPSLAVRAALMAAPLFFLFPLGEAHAPDYGTAAVFVAGVAFYLIFLGITAIISFLGLLFAFLRYRRGRRSILAIVLASLFMVPNSLAFFLYLYVFCYPDGPKNEDIPIIKMMGGVFLLVLAWFVMATLANRKARSSHSSSA